MNNRIKLFRRTRGMTQKQLADKVGLPVTTLSNYELGKRTPPVSVLKNIANVFHTSTAYLMGLDEPASYENVNPSDGADSQHIVYSELADDVDMLQVNWGGDLDDRAENILRNLDSFVRASHNNAMLTGNKTLVGSNIQQLDCISYALREIISSSFPEALDSVDNKLKGLDREKANAIRFSKLQGEVLEALNKLYLDNYFIKR